VGQSDLYAAAFDALPDEIAVVDGRGRVVRANAAWRDHTDVLAVPAVAAGVRAVLSGRANQFAVECEVDDGWTNVRVRPLADGPGAVVVLADVTERRRAEERARALQTALRQEAITDALTGVLTRRQLDRRVAEAVRLARRHARPLTCLMVDLDGFKAVNDQHGHQVGDEVLREVGRRLRLVARRSDVIGRYGGEEFVVLLPETDVEGAVTTAERVREAIRTPAIQARGLELSLDASVGVASFAEGGAADRLGLYAAADAALYAAKRAGRGRVVVDAAVANRAAG
jgi:diguanylate cyclase (GGDEF)-like protein